MWWKLLLVWIVVILIFTTMPWTDYVGHTHWTLVRWIPFYDHPLSLSDVLANVLLFLPFGFFLTRALARSSKRVWVVTLLAAVILSTSVEFFQVFSHDRIASTTDICSNLLGAIFGVILSTLL
jgi:glycopeptide antibiotics resistance protein